MSNASNLGYGGIKPFSNVDPKFANVGGTNNPSNFGSNEIPIHGKNTNHGASNNVVAASGKIGSLSFFKGGSSKRRRRGGLSLRSKIKKILGKYKGGSKRMRSRKRSLFRRKFRGSRSSRKLNRSRKFYGGSWSGPYQQFGSNQAYGHGYRTGVNMPIDGGKNIALANPPLFQSYVGGRRRRRQSMRGGAGVPQLSFSPCKSGCMDFYNHNIKSCGKLPYM